ncbi:hypothetical protein AQZ52_11125 [Novosphingobium fuchskuhlense]|uniref:DUF4942 domain-containing protein n=1 Tax=Novosphingobium fuchskuhlense TaxID=1117702 RepID=A0A117UUR4_9SPHN|nr:DUF4942 domain-containing protein [Novosphingobium fuchskuhlense]KUR71215.1 hypothetical protein AQZ52_11125 [Novosphingobium fuchskuhlense]
MNAIALPLTVADIVAEYEAKDRALAAEIKALHDAFTRLDLATTVQGTYVERVAQKPYLHIDTLRKNLLKSGWRAVYERLQIDSIASAKDRKLFDQALANPPPLSVETAKATFGDYLIRPRFHILRGLAEAFCALDPAYKSHSRVRIGVKGLPKRVVLNNWGGFSSTYGRDRFQDMANALAAFRRQPRVEWCEMLDIDEQHKLGSDAVMNGRTIKRYKSAGQEEEYHAPDRGLTIRKFGNGNAHVYFDHDALHAVNRALAEFYGEVLPDAEPEGVKPSASTAVSKDLQFYWSPPNVIERALAFAGVPDLRGWRHNRPAPMKVLEPSCGDGRILNVLRAYGHVGYGIEYHPGRAAEAKAKGHSVLCANFLDCEPMPFETVVMNPPFYGRHYVQHVRHALRFVQPGGVLVAILPATARYDHGELTGEWEDLPVASFADAGTNVPTTMLKIRKPA